MSLTHLTYTYIEIYIHIHTYIHTRASQVVLVVQNLPANAGDVRYAGSIPGSGRSPGEGNGNPFQCSCLENPMDRGVWRATVHGAAKSWTQLKRLSMHINTHTLPYTITYTHACTCMYTHTYIHTHTHKHTSSPWLRFVERRMFNHGSWKIDHKSHVKASYYY